MPTDGVAVPQLHGHGQDSATLGWCYTTVSAESLGREKESIQTTQRQSGIYFGVISPGRVLMESLAVVVPKSGLAA